MNIQSLTLSAMIAAAPFGCATPPMASPTSAEPARAAPAAAAPVEAATPAALSTATPIAPACALSTKEGANGVVLQAEIANPAAGLRSWRLEVASNGPGGSSRIAQSGEVAGPIGGREVVAEVRLGGSVDWEATLTVDGASGPCAARGRTPI